MAEPLPASRPDEAGEGGPTVEGQVMVEIP